MTNPLVLVDLLYEGEDLEPLYSFYRYTISGDREEEIVVCSECGHSNHTHAEWCSRGLSLWDEDEAEKMVKTSD